MIDIGDLINKYLFLLRNYWDELEQLISYDKTGSLKDDWLQANWELVVEGSLSQNSENSEIFLEVYGDGADVNSPSSRIIQPNKMPTHAVYCYSRSGEAVKDHLNDCLINLPEGGLPIDKFVSIKDDGWYYEKKPFDKVLIDYNGQQTVLDLDDVKFSLKEVN